MEYNVQDTCALYPCANGEICIRKGSVVCIDADGCDSDDLRVCSKCLMHTIVISCIIIINGILYLVSHLQLRTSNLSSICYISSISTSTVSPDSLLCQDDDDGDDNSVVCATNGVTYSSLCRLIQDTGNEAVAYAGPCDREECDGGPVR